jgi:transcriptional regulator with XRE-family HTH domain
MPARQASPAGKLLKHWREMRGLSQLELANRAGISARHLSFIETGRARPGRDVMLVLARALELPLWERNALLRASGNAPAFESGSLESPELASLLEMARLTIDQALPNLALVVDRHWNIILANTRAEADLDLCLGTNWRQAAAPINALKLLFSSSLAEHVEEWPRHAGMILGRLRREDASSADRGVARLHDALRAESSVEGVPYRTPNPTPLAQLALAVDGARLTARATITVLGTLEDVGAAGFRAICIAVPADDRPRFETLLTRLRPRVW